jgi:hypothetical protein
MAKEDQALTQDPFQEAEQNPLPAAQTPFQRLNAGSGIPMIDETLKRDVLQKQAQANLYHKNAADINGLLFHLADPEARKSYLNPQTGQPYTDDDIAQLQSQLEHATGQYEKLVGVDKESKGALQKARTIIDFIHGKRRAAMAPPPTPDYPTTVGDAGVTTTGVTTPRQGPVATPASFATNVSDAGVSYDPSKAQQLTPPPLSPLQEATRASAQLPFATHTAKVGQVMEDTRQMVTGGINMRRGIAKNMNLDETKPYVQDWILTGQMSGRMMGHFQKTTMVDPDTGQAVTFDPLSATYFNQDGTEVKNPIPFQKPQMVEVVMPNGDHAIGYEAYKKLTDQGGNPLPEGTKRYYPSAADTTTTTHTWKLVEQPDGSKALVPVTNVSERRKGGTSAPPVIGSQTTTPSTSGTAPSAKTTGGVAVGKPPNVSSSKASPQGNAAAAMGLPPGARIVGGKVPPGVAKAYDTYNGSVSRLKVMEEAIPKALKGDQQAMINLLYNHIGMTTGLQKGARITKDLISEAENSAPWEATILKRIGIDNEFQITPDLLRGVVLDSTTMHNMVALAEDRVNQDYSAWQREIGSAKTGYGMSTPPAPSSPDIGGISKPGGKPSTFKPF